MKQCPSCRTTYTDDTLSFCLADGSALTAVIDDEPTVVRGNLRIDIPPETDLRTAPQVAPASGSSAGKWIKILAAIILLGFLVIAAAGILGFVFYCNTGGNNTNISSKPSTPTAVPTSTPDTEKQRLQDELANLQKKVAEQSKTPANTMPFPTSDESQTVTATAHSPGDGFLALRSEPNSETGERITKIPHGARLDIGACGDYITTSRNNRGRWCRARYNAYSGWVFDAFVRY
jgi:hypothetical protein